MQILSLVKIYLENIIHFLNEHTFAVGTRGTLLRQVSAGLLHLSVRSTLKYGSVLHHSNQISVPIEESRIAAMLVLRQSVLIKPIQ